ncbi:MAG: alpha/beta fold hydrolase [Actinomycetes bacterium]
MVALPTETAWLDADEVPGPPLPLGERVPLSGRGTTFVRRVEGPPGAPTVLLIHGWCASGGLNWYQAFGPVGEHYSVLAPDLRGHGRGIRTNDRFRLRDCADDLAALIEREGCGPVIAVGYSMGGPTAQLLWKRHPHLVAGLVLCATGAEFVTGHPERRVFAASMMAAAAGLRVGTAVAHVPHTLGRRIFGGNPPTRPSSFATWVREEFRRHDLRLVAEAGRAVSTFSSRRWVGRIDVPTSVLITTRDRAVSADAQHRLALAIPGATTHRMDDTHLACTSPEFGRRILKAVQDVDARR